LIIGYDELIPTAPLNPGDRGAAHRLVIGRYNRFTKAAFGGLVAGERNTIINMAASVTGGEFNTASGFFTVVIGGSKVTDNGDHSIAPQPPFPLNKTFSRFEEQSSCDLLKLTWLAWAVPPVGNSSMRLPSRPVMIDSKPATVCYLVKGATLPNPKHPDDVRRIDRNVWGDGMIGPQVHPRVPGPPSQVRLDQSWRCKLQKYERDRQHPIGQ
jgi:hypothetical protein